MSPGAAPPSPAAPYSYAVADVKAPPVKANRERDHFISQGDAENSQRQMAVNYHPQPIRRPALEP
jgi:hypothetical protein